MKIKSLGRSTNMTMVEMRVHIDCEGCENKIKKALKKLDGVEDVEIDMDMQKVTVTGWLDQMKVLKTVRKTGRRAELWPFPYNPEYNNYASEYYDETYLYQKEFSANPTEYASSAESELPMSSYNYRKHGYDGHYHGYYRQLEHLSAFDKRATDMFSDDNPHACSIM